MARIRGVIHVCQIGPWKRSLTMLMRAIVKSGLYDVSESIELCIVTNTAPVIDIGLPKIKSILVGRPHEYERPTLLRLRSNAEQDTDEVFYWYVHTKGLRWFGTPKEENIIDWIDLLLHWNIYEWKQAVSALESGYHTYGCNQTNIPINHYSGNFWWSCSSHIRRLPKTIENGYNDPEFWITRPSDTRWMCIFRSGLEGMGHYDSRYPRNNYQ